MLIVKKLSQISFTILLLVLMAVQAHATFTSLYAFSDGLSTTTNNTSGLNYYYGKRNSNGRVWLEVLAQRLGLGANSITNVNWSNSSNNWSYYGQYSFNLITNLNHFSPPPDAATALFVVWVSDADSVNDMSTIYPSTNGTTWNNAINQSLANHWNIITNLYYSKGARTIIMPNAVDITEIPVYGGLQVSAPAKRNFVRQQIINFNIGFDALVNQAQTSLTNLGSLTIYEPDYFSLVDNMLTNTSTYGLTNPVSGGVSVYAVEQGTAYQKLNGPGTNYIFWDQMDPTAKVHEILADSVLQMVAPVQFGNITALSSSAAPVCVSKLDIINMPVGLNGFVDGTTNLGQQGWTWTPVANISSSFTTPSFVVNTPSLPPILGVGGFGSIYPGGGGSSGGTQSTNLPSYWQSFRLRFPFAWSWP